MTPKRSRWKTSGEVKEEQQLTSPNITCWEHDPGVLLGHIPPIEILLQNSYDYMVMIILYCLTYDGTFNM